MNSQELILQETWLRLKHASKDRRDPFHQVTLATVHTDQTTGIISPAARIVTLRHVDPESRTIRFHIDARSPKFFQLESCPYAELLFHSTPDKLQIRLQASVTLHTSDETADAAWNASQLLSRRCYCQTHAPGTAVTEPSLGLPGELAHREPTEEEAEVGRPNFCAVLCHVNSLDWYSLAFTGHKRARYTWDTEHNLNSTWLLP